MEKLFLFNVYTFGKLCVTVISTWGPHMVYMSPHMVYMSPPMVYIESPHMFYIYMIKRGKLCF